MHGSLVSSKKSCVTVDILRILIFAARPVMTRVSASREAARSISLRNTANSTLPTVYKRLYTHRGPR